MFVVTGSKKETKEIAIKKSGKKNDMCIESINEGKTKDNETDLSSLDEKELKLKQVEEELMDNVQYGISDTENVAFTPQVIKIKQIMEIIISLILEIMLFIIMITKII